MLYLVKKVEKLKNNNIKKILIIRLSALGDTIHTLPFANALRKKYPNVQLDWIVEDKAEKFILNNPLLNNVYVLERKKWKEMNFYNVLKEFFLIIKKIRSEQYDIVIDTQQLLKSAILMGLSKGKRKIALDGGREFSWLFANEIIKTNRKQFDIDYHVVKRNLTVIYSLRYKQQRHYLGYRSGGHRSVGVLFKQYLSGRLLDQDGAAGRHRRQRGDGGLGVLCKAGQVHYRRYNQQKGYISQP